MIDFKRLDFMRTIRQRGYWLVCIMLALATLSNPAQAQKTTKIDSIVALVDDDVILRSELDLAIKGIVDRIPSEFHPRRATEAVLSGSL